MGISFAIPIDEASRISDQLRATGRVQRGRIGVQIDQVSKEVAESLGLSKAQGALVRAVEPGDAEGMLQPRGARRELPEKRRRLKKKRRSSRLRVNSWG